MKKYIVTLVVLGCFLVTAQDFQGKAEYFTKKILNKKVEKIQSDRAEPLDPEFEKLVQEALKKATEKKYVLTFNKTECLYEQEQELQKPEATSNGMSISFSFSGSGKKYFNLKDKKNISEDEIFGKEFLIIEPLAPLNWKLMDETKKIGEYTCFKAELIRPVSEKQKQEYEEFLKKEEAKPALFKMQKPEAKVVTAWYTAEIPVSFGPNNYWGLPGLILEVNDGESILLCSKVSLSNKEKTKIKVPSTGKKVSQEEFDTIEKAKTDSMKDEDGNVIFQTHQ